MTLGKLFGVAVVCCGLLWTADAEAQVQYRLRNKVPEGQRPVITIVAQESMERVGLIVQREDGQKQTFERSDLSQGSEVEVPLKQTKGAFHYQAQLTFKTLTGQEGQADFQFQAVVAPPLQLTLKRGSSSIDRKTVVLTANAPVSRGEIGVIGSDGSHIANNTVDLEGVAPGGDLVLTWSGSDEGVARIDIKIHDQMGFWQTVELVPFTVDIPHDEVNFDSGKATFAASEEGKLEKTYVLLSQELEKHGSDLEISLYIAGYTDTVGPARANIGLSTSRARAIAAWFRKRGIRIPIYYQGFGESVLAVQTADNVDEKRNRRALYILGNQKPLRSAQLPRSDWKLLR